MVRTYEGGKIVVLAILDRVVRDSLSEKLTFEGGEGTRNHVLIWRKRISSRANSKWHGPEAEPASHV